MADSAAHRRRRLLALCAQREREGRELARELGVSRRTVDADLRWAKGQFSRGLKSRFDGRHRRLFRFEGDLPALLPRPLEYVTGAELVAIVAARGLLRLPVDGAAEKRTSPYPGLLDGALHRLLARAGLAAQVSDLAPEAIQVSRFAARPEDPDVLAAVVEATVRQQALRFDYTNRSGESHPVHAMPRRLVLIRGEFHCFMWTPREGVRRQRSGGPSSGGAGSTTSPAPSPLASAPAPPFGGVPESDDGQPGRIKQYRISRMSSVESTPEPPRGCPTESKCWRIDRELAEAFETTGSASPEARRRVRLCVSPVAMPHLEHRTWGGEQRWLAPSLELPPGWRRLEFWTTGIAACRHWVLSFGAELRAESPAELVTWLREEAAKVALAHGGAASGRRAAGRSPLARREAPSAVAVDDPGDVRSLRRSGAGAPVGRGDPHEAARRRARADERPIERPRRAADAAPGSKRRVRS